MAVIPILNLLKLPHLWRCLGFISSVIGLLCYALSSSFKHLFGEWNLLKSFLYAIVSLVICTFMLFAKKWKLSTGLMLKAHVGFLVLMVTSVYSFFYDKTMKGKTDVLGLISCASFAFMSFSLSRQINLGFEVDLLNFFLGCLTVQLMKINLILALVGAVFCYFLILLRSSLDSQALRTGGVGITDHVAVQVEAENVLENVSESDQGRGSSTGGFISRETNNLLENVSESDQGRGSSSGGFISRETNNQKELPSSRKRNTKQRSIKLSPTLEDNHSWRKYGQKAIIGSQFPRSYYRCTYRNVEGCLATKQVQKIQENPVMFQITYIGLHTCKNTLNTAQLVTDSVTRERESILMNSHTDLKLPDICDRSTSSSNSRSTLQQGYPKEDTLLSSLVPDNFDSFILVDNFDTSVWSDLLKHLEEESKTLQLVTDSGTSESFLVNSNRNSKLPTQQDHPISSSKSNSTMQHGYPKRQHNEWPCKDKTIPGID